MCYLINGEVNPHDVVLGYWTGALTAGTGLWGTVGVNAASGATSSNLKGDDPLPGAFGNAGASLSTEIINDQAGKVDIEKMKGNGK